MWNLILSLFGMPSSQVLTRPATQAHAPRVITPRTVTQSATLARPASVPQQRPRMPRVYGSDRIGLVGFNDTGFFIAVPADPFAAWLLNRTKKVHTWVRGNTNMTDGLRKAVQMLENGHPGYWRKIWLLSDGQPNIEVDGLGAIVRHSRDCEIRVNTIGFGDQYNGKLLADISRHTGGRFVTASTLRELVAALVQATDVTEGSNRRKHQAEATVLAIDLSNSMNGPMEGRRKVDVVEDAVLQLLYYKQKCFS